MMKPCQAVAGGSAHQDASVIHVTRHQSNSAQHTKATAAASAKHVLGGTSKLAALVWVIWLSDLVRHGIDR